MHTPREPHLTALKWILRYLRGSLDYGILLRPTLTSKLVVYTDAKWAGCPDTRRSTLSYVVLLGANLVSWASSGSHRLPLQRRCRVPRCGQRHGGGLLDASATPRAPQPPSVCHPRLLRQHQRRLPLHQSSAASAHEACGDQLHFIREHVTAGDIWVLNVPTTLQFADIFTRGYRRVYF
jgi:hypothetical protein